MCTRCFTGKIHMFKLRALRPLIINQENSDKLSIISAYFIKFYFYICIAFPSVPDRRLVFILLIKRIRIFEAKLSFDM